MDKYEKIKEILDELDDTELVSIHNNYCDMANYPDDIIYTSDMFDELNANSTPSEIAMSVCFGDFNPNDNYWWYDGYANYESGDVTKQIYTNDIANYCVDNEEDFGNDDIKEILNRDEEEEEEDEE